MGGRRARVRDAHARAAAHEPPRHRQSRVTEPEHEDLSVFPMHCSP
jgi:hypothetical protein